MVSHIYILALFAIASLATEGERTYFTGTRAIDTPNGQRASVDAATFIRFVASDSAIVEGFVSTPLGNEPAERVLTFKVTGSRFRVVDPTGVFSGSGTLRGESWRWSGWEAGVQLAGGITIEVNDSLSRDSLISHQRVFAPNGQLVAAITDRMGRVDSTRYADVRSRVLAR